MRKKPKPIGVVCGFALLLGAASSSAGQGQAETGAAKATPTPTIFAAQVKPTKIAPGKAFKVTYKWQAVPLDKDYAVFVHFVSSAGAIILQDDHAPPVATSKWTGPVSYTRTVDVPATAPAGLYKIIAGLYAALPNNGGWQNLPLRTGKGVIGDKGSAYQVGVVTFDPNAPAPPLDSAGPVTLNLKGYKLTFADEFNALSVSSRGPGTRWIAHTPFGGDFGDAGFADPAAGFPFTVSQSILRIEARKNADGWKAGLLSSVDPKGNGFSQTYGYFEMRAKFPKGPGSWPAFWLLSVDKLKKPASTGIEVDVVEQYGHAPQSLFATLHWWGDKGKHEGVGNHSIVQDMTEGFHKYGFLWDEKNMVWFFDGVEMWRQPTPPEARTPMYVLVDLALGGGWPIIQTPNPSYLFVDYVRAYAKTGPKAANLLKPTFGG